MTDIVKDLTAVPENNSVLLLRGDYLFDDRIIHYLVQNPDVLLKVSLPPNNPFVAAHVATAKSAQAFEVIEGTSATDAIPGIRT